LYKVFLQPCMDSYCDWDCEEVNYCQRNAHGTLAGNSRRKLARVIRR